MTNISRRGFLNLGALALGSAMLPSLARAQENVSIHLRYTDSQKKFIFVNLEGAPDGLELLVPYNDPHLQALRGNIFLGAPGKGKKAPLKLDGDFAVSSKLPEFQSLYRNKQYIGIHAAALQHENRSHFDAQNMLGNGTLNPNINTTGWMNRLSRIIGQKAKLNSVENALLSIAPHDSAPLAMRGAVRPTLVDKSASYPLSDGYFTQLLDTFENYSEISEHRDHTRILRDALQQRRAFNGFSNNVATRTPLKERVRTARTDADRAGIVGTLMSRADGPRIAILTLKGWDSHAAQFVNGTYGRQLDMLNNAIKALRINMGAQWRHAVILAGGEFGRTCGVNGTNGTDHGIATSWHLMGGAVQGGRMLSDWPGLREKDMIDGRYLRPTTQIVGIFKGVLQDSFDLSLQELARIFPGTAHIAPVSGLLV